MLQKKDRETLRIELLEKFRENYPDGHMTLQDASKFMGISQRRLKEYGVVGFRYGRGKRVRIELVADGVVEQRGGPT